MKKNLFLSYVVVLIVFLFSSFGVNATIVDLTGSDDPAILKSTLGGIGDGDTIVLKRGMAYDLSATSISKSVMIMSVEGAGSPAVLDMGASSLDIASGSALESLVFMDVEVKGDITAAYLMNFSTDGSINEFILDNVYLHNLRGVFRCKNGGVKTISMFKINNAVVDSIGGYGVMIMDNAEAYCSDVEISNSTFSSVGQLLRWRSTDDVNSVVISGCTFYDTPNDGYIIRLDTDSVLNGVVISNSVFGKSNNKLKSTANSGSRVAVTATNCYMTADCTLKPEDFMVAPMTYAGSDADLFADVATKDFSITDLSFMGKFSAGDPRWYMAHEDRTNEFMTNPGFDIDCNYLAADAAANLGTADNGSANLAVTGWTPNSTSWAAGAAFEYGYAGTLNSPGPIPATASDGSTTGAGHGALGVCAAWGGNSYYTQEVTLPAGTYVLKYNVYNSGPAAAGSSLVGWIPDGGAAVLSSLANMAQNVWTPDEITFTLEYNTTGMIQVGVKAVNAGSASNGRYFFDDLQLNFIALPEAELRHSYTFEVADTAIDVVGDLDGELFGDKITVADGKATVSGAAASTDGYIAFDAAALALKDYDAITLELYLETADGANGAYTMLCYFGNNNGGQKSFWFQPTIDGNASRAAVDNTNPVAQLNGIEMDDGKLHHVVAILTPDALEYYLDGSLAASVATGGDYISTIDTVIAQLFKGPNGWADVNYNGTIDEFNIYNGALGKQAILDHAEAFIGSSNSDLGSLSVGIGELKPPFESFTRTYTVNIPGGTETVAIDATAKYSGAVVKGTGDFSITQVIDTAEVVVVAEDGNDSTTYLVIFSSLSPITGTIIGHASSWGDDPATYIDAAFDGDINTYVDAPTATGYVGYDFGAGRAATLTAFKYAPRSGHEGRMVGGELRGANSPDLSDAVTLYTITDAPGFETTLVGLEMTESYRYIYYYSADGYCNISELEMFGVVKGLMHSYTFEDGTAADVVGGADGEVVINDGGSGNIENGAFNAMGGSYVKLPAKDIALNSYNEVTLEATVKTGSNPGWTMLAYFGSAGGDNSYWMSIARADNVSKTSVDMLPSSSEVGVTGAEPGADELHHYVSVLTDDSIKWYIDGVKIGAVATPAAYLVSGISLDTALLCAGGYPDPQWIGSVYEFNIYEGELDAETIASKAEAALQENGPKKVAYVTESKTMAETAAQPDADPIVTMLMEDE
ncbi:LamG-like jellyroll fold domain-containing protein, partial [Saccharicrinis sp. FJH54]|uniref:LamG-like jellyroll fold domain-containing protein n=1 Tax=Saccharicrinis sp. FJH54 TaxID=3344665 RepID=UPI0035D52383